MFSKWCLSFVVVLHMPFLLLGQYQKSTLKVNGKQFVVLLDSSGFYIRSVQNQILFTDKTPYYSHFIVIDFNRDGNKDILLEIGGTNTPAVFNLLEYVPKKGKYIAISNFNKFPDPKRIGKTGYYYSYHRNGCADACWESDFFFIKNHEAIRIGNIDCEFLAADEGAISIYKLIHGKRQLIKTYPVHIIDKYSGNKLHFIKSYWFKNYSKFL